MTKELRISASVPLPDDFGERVALMNKINPVVQQLGEALGVSVDVKDVTIKTKTAKPAA